MTAHKYEEINRANLNSRGHLANLPVATSLGPNSEFTHKALQKSGAFTPMDLGVSMCSKVWLPDTTWSPTQDLSLRTLEGQPLLRVGSDLRTVPLLGLQPSILGSAV